MASIQIVGDSQSGNPGFAARTALSALKHRVHILRNDGKGPYDYVRMPELWQSYREAVRKSKPDLMVLIFGTNDAPNDKLADALAKLKSSIAPKVILTGLQERDARTGLGHSRGDAEARSSWIWSLGGCR